MRPVKKMTDRFGDLPAWARRILWWSSLSTYMLVAMSGLIGLTWPKSDAFNTVEFISARGSGLIVLLASLVCLASYPMRRWRWELVGSWIAGTGVAVYVFVALSVDPLSSRGLLTASLIIVVLSIYGRGVHLLAFAQRTTHARRLANGDSASGVA